MLAITPTHKVITIAPSSSETPSLGNAKSRDVSMELVAGTGLCASTRELQTPPFPIRKTTNVLPSWVEPRGELWLRSTFGYEKR